MKKLSSLLVFFLGLVIISKAQTVTIGTQVWCRQNLDVTIFRNGDPIPEVKTNEEWNDANQKKQPAWCHYDNDPSKGKLYNGYAVADPRGLAPLGYHIPNNDEWSVLSDFLGGTMVAGSKLRSRFGWIENKELTKFTGFSGLPSGYRDADGSFNNFGKDAYWWSSSSYARYESVTCFRHLDAFFKEGNEFNSRGGFLKGYSVRCLKD